MPSMTTPPMTLRQAKADEAGGLSHLHGRCFDEAWSADFIARVVGGPGGIALAAVDPDNGDPDGGYIGFAFVRVTADEAELLSIGVLPEWRDGGVGRLLVRAAIERARATGAVKIHLEVADDNHPARALYNAAGFRQVGRRPGYYDKTGADALTMALDLI